jgi:hypothetical protein
MCPDEKHRTKRKTHEGKWGGGVKNTRKMTGWEECEGRRYQSRAILRQYPVTPEESNEEVQSTG